MCLSLTVNKGIVPTSLSKTMEGIRNFVNIKIPTMPKII